MARPAPKRITDELINQINSLMQVATTYYDSNDFQVRLMRQRAEKLYQADAKEAYLCQAMIEGLVGDFPAASKHLFKARRLNAYEAADDIECHVASNLGYFGHAAALLEKSAKAGEAVGEDIHLRLICGLFGGFSEVGSPVEEGTIDGNSSRRSLVDIAMKAIDVMPQIGVSDQDVTAMLDVAGEVLRERRLFWLRDRPLVRVVDAGSASSILYQYVIGASPATVVDLTEEVALRLMAREIDKPGLMFSFLPEVDSDGRPLVE